MFNFLKSRTIYFWYFTVLTFIAFAPILTPIFSHLGLTSISKFFYFIYSFTCHQFHTRSLHLYDFQYAWCSRDTGIWLGVWLTTLLIRLGILKKIKIWWIPLFAIPMALDGGIQTLNTFMDLLPSGELLGEGYYSNNLFKFMTGSFFGAGLAMFFSPQMMEVVDETKMKIKNFAFTQKIRFYKALQFIGLGIIFLSIYILLVFLWNLTSQNYKPTNFLDSVPKIQEGNFFQRRQNGECPTNDIDDVLGLDCFFGDL